jgi:hypothetical protein
MRRLTFKARKILSISVLVLSCVCSPFALGIALLLRSQAARSLDSRNSWRGIFAFALLGTVLYGLILWFIHPLPLLLVEMWRAIRSGHLAAGMQPVLFFWGYHGLLAPLLSLALEALVQTTQPVHLAPRAVVSRPEEVRRQRQRVGGMAGERAAAFPVSVDGEAVIGYAVSGSLWPWVRESYLVYPRAVLFYHAVVVAQSGMGKSALLRRIAYALAKHWRMKVLWIDGKGDWKDMSRFEATMRLAGAGRIGLFPLVAHAGWQGTRKDVLNLLMATQIFERDYYRGVTRNILELALYAPNLPAVASGAELLRRIYPPTLLALYQSAQESTYLQSLTTDALWGPYNKYQAFFSAVGDRLDGTLGYGDWDAAYYLLDEKRLQEEQVAPFARFLIDDFNLYLGLRQVEGKQRPILLVLDDFSAYSRLVPVHKLYERVRSAHGMILLSAQGYEGLGEDAERLIEDAATMLLGKCNLPEKLIRVAGKKKTPSFSYQFPEETEEGAASSREQEQARTMMHEEERWLVEPDEVRGLGVGEAYVLYGPAAHKIAVERVMLDEDAVERRAAELLQTYEEVQAHDEANRERALGSLPLLPQEQGQGGKKQRKKRKPAAPQPPQPDDVAGVGPASSGKSGGDEAKRTAEAERPPLLSLDDIE